MSSWAVWVGSPGNPLAAPMHGGVITMAAAESLAQLCRDHGHPARVVVGRRRGTIRIRVAEWSVGSDHSDGKRWQTTLLPACRESVREWLDY